MSPKAESLLLPESSLSNCRPRKSPTLFSCPCSALCWLFDALGAEEHLKFTEVAHRNQVELEWSDGVVVLNMLKLQFAWMLSRDQQDDKRSRMGRRRLTSSEVPPRRRFRRRGSRLSAAQQLKGVGRAPFVLFLSSSLRIAVDAAKLNSLSQGSSWTPPS